MLPRTLESALLDIFAGSTALWDARIAQLCITHANDVEAIKIRAQALKLEFAGTPRTPPRGTAGTVESPAVSDAPSAIGPYKILGELGHGGMGSVYLAERREPVHQRVALKLIKLGMDSKAVLARFQAERQALALMEHSNIAKVFDAGSAPDGRPYFVMEYVKGLPITRYCDENKLALEDRLALFRQVCAGVQHAHSKGVIHRDLTPNNILVTVQDGKPAAKIIDFGLARATERQRLGETIFTEQGVVLGTPEYMSPEQAGLGALDVDTRSDVYTLGVLLYELLVGDLPFSRKELQGAGFAEMQRKIREDDPPRPSTKITTKKVTGADVASRRRTNTGSLLQRMRGDLDWVVMKCLEKDRARRYDTVAALSEDVLRHLDQRPIEARPPSVTYQLGKMLSRHRGTFAVAAAFVTLLIASSIIMTMLYLRAQDQEQLAAAQAREARENLQRFEQVADLVTLDDLLRERDALWPEREERVAAMEAWLQRAQTLANRLERHRSDLERVRGRARPPHGDELDRVRKAQELRQGHARVTQLEVELADLRARPVASRTADHGRIVAATAELTTQRRTLMEAEQQGGEPRQFFFADARDQFLHDNLERLVLGIEELQMPRRGAIDLVRRRVDNARTLAAIPRVHAHAWQQAIDSIANPEDCPLYGGLRIEPQAGLVPLCRNPDTGLWEFAHWRSGTPARWDANQDLLDFDETSGVVLVLLPGGEARVGTQAQDSNAAHFDPESESNESPPAEVRLDPFFIARFELTQHQWMELTEGQNPSENSDGSLHRPVERVDAITADRVLARHGLVLPTETQWEYACRAGTQTPWWTGHKKESLDGAANLADRTAREGGIPGPFEDWLVDGWKGTSVMAMMSRANAFGLFDVHGNVAEWCRDNIEPRGAPRRLRDGDGELIEQGNLRVVRGGSFGRLARDARSARRMTVSPTSTFPNLGLRAARELER